MDPCGTSARVWKTAVRDACSLPYYDARKQTRVRGLAHEVAEAHADDLANAVTRFPEQVMRAWRIDHAEILRLVNQKAPISQGTPRWREVEVELASLCIAALEAHLCQLCLEPNFATFDLRLFVKRVCFEEVFGYFCFLLRGTAPSS